MLLAACTGLTMAAMIAVSGSPAHGRSAGVLVRSEHGLLAIESDGLYPGDTEVRTLHLTNPNDVGIRVHAVTAVVGLPVDGHGRPVAGCLPVVAQVEPLGTPVLVPTNGTSDVTVSVHLATTVQRACRQVRFPLYYAAAASRS